MILSELQSLRLNLYIQERELAALLTKPTSDPRELALTQQAIDRLRGQLCSAVVDG